MSTHELHLDDLTYARVKRLAEQQNVSVEEVISAAIDCYSAAPSDQPSKADIIGAMSDSADLLDEIVTEAYQNRERVPLRLKSE